MNAKCDISAAHGDTLCANVREGEEKAISIPVLQLANTLRAHDTILLHALWQSGDHNHMLFSHSLSPHQLPCGAVGELYSQIPPSHLPKRVCGAVPWRQAIPTQLSLGLLQIPRKVKDRSLTEGIIMVLNMELTPVT